jgi:hypothetical protein
MQSARHKVHNPTTSTKYSRKNRERLCVPPNHPRISSLAPRRAPCSTCNAAREYLRCAGALLHYINRWRCHTQHKAMAIIHKTRSKRRPPMCAAGHLPAFSTAGSAAAAVPHCASYAASAALPIPVTGPAATFAASNAVDRLKTLRGGLERLAAAEAEGAEGAVEAEREVDVVPARCWRPDLPPVRIARARWDRCSRACKLYTTFN